MIRSPLAAGLCLICNIGFACDLADAESVKLDDGVTLQYRIEPSPLAVAQHFSMQFLVCRSGMSIVPDKFKIDAVMPAHGHGMNYRANVDVRQDALVEVTGLLFQMPGRWQILVDLSYESLDQRVEIDYQL